MTDASSDHRAPLGTTPLPEGFVVVTPRNLLSPSEGQEGIILRLSQLQRPGYIGVIVGESYNTVDRLRTFELTTTARLSQPGGGYTVRVAAGIGRVECWTSAYEVVLSLAPDDRRFTVPHDMDLVWGSRKGGWSLERFLATLPSVRHSLAPPLASRR